MTGLRALLLVLALLVQAVPTGLAGGSVAARVPRQAASASAPAAAPAPADEADPFAPDPAFLIGTLRNGLRYYIRTNKEPERRAVLRLVIKAGSLDEQDAERGYAHFVEHMAFNGTKHFKPGALVKYFEERGARFGAHVNAETSFDDTSYFLAVPSDRVDLVDRGLEALADFAARISFDRAEVDRERPVIVEEWRLRQGVGSRLLAKQLPLLYHDSRYADRLPIGTLDSLARATPDALRRFHRTWYRPEQMAVIVVGDIERGRAETLVRRHFDGLRAVGRPAARADDAVPLHEETLVNVAADAEATASTVTVLRKRRKSSAEGLQAYREGLEADLVGQMMSARLADITRKPDAPWLGASITGQSLSDDVEAAGFSVRTKDGQIVAGLDAMLAEEERVRRHGFLAVELERARQRARAGMEHAYAERDKVQSGTLAGMCEDNFLSGEPLFVPDRLFALGRRELDRITLDLVNARARDDFKAEHQVVLVTTPLKEGVVAPAETEVRQALASVATRPIEPWTETAMTRRLMETPPAAGKVVARRTVPELGATVVTFANGIEAWLKPTDFRNEQISFGLQGPGGTARVPRALFEEATLAVAYVSQAGVGGLSASELSKLLAGKLGSARPFIGLSTHGIAGGATPEFLETALQLLYLGVTSPNQDPDALALVKRQVTASLANRAQSPNALFNERLAAVNMSGHYTTEVPTVERIAQLDLEKMLAFYRASFADFSDTTFVMVGNFDVDRVLPSLEQYIGGLAPAAIASAPAEPFSLQFPASVVRERVVKGREPSSRTVITFHTPATNDLEVGARLGATLGILDVRLRDGLREALGQTYSVSLGRASYLPLSDYGTISVSFGSAPDNVDGLVAAVLKEIDQFKRDGPTAAELKTYQEQSRRSLETSVKQNGYWLGALQGSLAAGHDPRTILDRAKRIESLTTDAVRETARGAFSSDRYTVVSLVPEPPAK